MRRLLVTAVLALTGSGCVGTTTQLAPIAPEAVEAEEILQRELVLVELNAAQRRLDDLAFPLLVAATPLCEDRVAHRLGVSFGTLDGYKGEWREAARVALGLTDTVTVISVAAGSPAETAGVLAGDRVAAVNGAALPLGDDGLKVVGELLTAGMPGDVALTLHRAGTVTDLSVQSLEVCDFGTMVTIEGDINAFADGDRVIIPWAMMRFADDEELVGVLGHEIAHNAMGHIEARKRNVLMGGLLGAVFDVAMATQGVNSYGENTTNFMSAAARAFSQDFEREADYVGMYILARAGVPLETVPDFWRQFAQINPSAISYASTHPTTAERFVRLRQAIEEIQEKERAGEELMPEFQP